MARLLASKHKCRLVAIIPSFIEGDYWYSVNRGINRAISDLKKFNVKLDYLFFDQSDGKSFAQVTEKLLDEDFDGVIIATLFGEIVIKLSKSLDEKEIPYVYIDSNIPNQKNLAYYGADSFVSGSIAAKLMLSEIGNKGDIIVSH